MAVPRGGKRGDVPPLAFKEGEGGGRGEGRFWARRAQKYEKNGYQLVFLPIFEIQKAFESSL